MLAKWSSIRKKTVTTLLLTTLVLVGLIGAACVFILLPEAARLEETTARGDLQRTLVGAADELDSVRQAAALRAFLVTASEGKQNLPDAQMDVTAVLSENGEVLSIEENGAGGVDWGEALSGAPAALAAGASQDERAGWMVISGRAWMVAVAGLSAPQSGWALAGRALDETRLTGLPDARLQIYAAADADLPADGAAALAALQAGSAPFARAIDGDEIGGYALVEELSGQPALLRLTQARSIYTQARDRITIFMAAVLAAAILFALVVSRSLDHAVIARLEEFSGEIEKMRKDQDFSHRIDLPGNDELSHLAGGINDTIEALETSTRALKENQERLAHDALHDILTQLPNRVYFNQRLNQAMALLEVERVSQVAVLFLDLDGFKLINESYDHRFGDRILVASGERVRMVLRGDDFVARLGGDEFGVLLEDLHTTEEAERVAQRILEDIRRPFDLDGHTLFLTASIGIAATTHLMRGEELLRNADMAMYTAKDRGKNGYAIFATQMHSDALDRLNLENDLRRAIERDELVIYYQPIVSLFDGKVTALEALMRWQHPERGLVMPEVFLHVIKEAGLMFAMNQVLFRKAFGQLSEWRAQGLTELRMAINVSARVLPESSFWDLFERELYAAGIPPSVIQIEVVESEMAASIDMTLAALERLRGMGVTISVDDFGTGYSSLAYLKRLPIHCLKIDRTFIKDVIFNRDDAAIVSAMIVMAHVLDLDVVAEGVETEGQFRFLLDQSCEKAQGYLMAHPEPAENLTEMLLSGKRLLPENGPD